MSESKPRPRCSKAVGWYTVLMVMMLSLIINEKWKKEKGIKELGLKNLWPSAEYSPQIIILHWQHTFFR